MRNLAPKPVSPKQEAFIRSLLNDRNPDEGLRREADEVLVAGYAREASGIIERLLNAPRVQAERHEAAAAFAVPGGRYALPSDFDPDGTPVFYRVDEGSGKWEGYTFLSRLVGPNEDRIRDRTERERILALIAEDTAGALRRYGHLSGHCGNCGLELTDKFSRFIGVGPVCREKLDLPKSEAAFVRGGGVLPDEYLREVAAEAEAALDEKVLAEGQLDYVYSEPNEPWPGAWV